MTEFEFQMLLLQIAFLVFLLAIPLAAFTIPPIRPSWINHLRGPLAVLLLWLAYNLYVTLYWDLRSAELIATPNPTEAELASATADGANRVFALIFAWLPATVYVIIFWAVGRLLRSGLTRARLANRP